MANINKIRLSGTTYNIEDENASKTVELTQAQYDALEVKEPNTYYVITDATAADMTNYYDKTETDDLLDAKADTATTYTKTEVDTALATKQATLVSGTNIKTINNESILGSGNITIQGSGGGIDSGTVQTMIDESISGKTDTSAFTAHTGDSTIHVTSADKSAWNAKSDFSGSYNDLTDKPTIPTSVSQLTNDAGYATSGYVDSAVSGKANSSDVYTKSQTSGATEIATALSGKQDTLSAGTNITISGNVISAEGGGKAVAAGTNISITTGATADTINCTIPAFFHSNTLKGDIEIGSNDGVNSDYGRLVIGRRVQSRGNPFFQYSIGIGVQPDNSNNYCQLYGQNSVGIGRGFKIGSDSLYANGINNAIAIGHNATSRNNGDITLGADTTASGGSSVAIGSGATANGSDYKMNLNNQIKVTPSNQVYISNSANTSTYCLQEKIENTESALGGLKLVSLTQAQYDALSTKDASTIYFING